MVLNAKKWYYMLVNMMNFLFDGIKLPNSYEEEKILDAIIDKVTKSYEEEKILDVIIDKVTKQLRGGENK